MKQPITCLSLVILVIAVPALAQNTQDADLADTKEQITSLLGRIENSTSHDETKKAQILELCDGALGALETATANRRAAAEHERELAGVDRMVEALRAELAKPMDPPEISLPPDVTVARVEDLLARKRARLAANRSALRDAERRVEERAKIRAEIAERLGSLDQEIQAIDDELVTGIQRYTDPDLRAAARLNALSRRQRAVSEITMHRATLALLDRRGALLPLEVDLAQRRVADNSSLVEQYVHKAAELRDLEADASLREIQRSSRAAAAEVPELAAIADETEEFAERLWGPDGIIKQAEAVTASLIATRKHQSDLNRIAELSRRKFEAYGQRGSATRWWPDVPADFPKSAAVLETIHSLEAEIPEVSHRLIILEEQRARAIELSSETRLALEAAYGGDVVQQAAVTADELLAVRRDLLDRLIQEYGRYSNVLVEHLTVSRNFISGIEAVQKFLFNHVLWVRSVPRPTIPRAGDVAAAARWIASPSPAATPGILDVSPASAVRPRDVVVLTAAVVLLLMSGRLARRLAAVADPVEDPERDAFRFTLEAFVVTVLRAAPLPMVLLVGSWIVDRAGSTPYLTSSARALFLVATIVALLEFTRQLFAPRGLAEAHFNWPSKITRRLNRGLLIPELVATPLLYIAIQLAFAGILVDSPPHLQSHNNSLGRIAFVLGLGFLGMSLLTLVRPEKKQGAAVDVPLQVWSRLFSKYAFPIAVLIAYPLILLATIVPVVLAVFGFYLTGVLLAYQMLRTIALSMAVLVGGGLVHRWRVVNRRKLIQDIDLENLDVSSRREIAVVESQTRQLFRFVAVAVMAVGLVHIWSDALPLLQAFKRVQLWPRLTVTSALEDATLSELATVSKDETSPPATTGASDSASGDAAGGNEADARSQVAEETPPTVLTLWNLLEAIIAGVVAYVLARNLPGLLEFFLRRRTNVDSGARVAFATLVRYSITIIGVTAVFGLLGVSWSKIQWLAAALTFGLGFGLQEIVANFVSGLILLVERPVRVGDVVTIGTLMGKVTRIQIRATTITLWDRSEMIVPNKEFITTKLVNWTLSDSKRRIEIPVRIAYGADLDLVKSIMVEIATEHPAVLDDPEPHVLLLSFGDDAVQLELRFVVDFGKGLATKDEVQMAIDKAFKQHGIEFALPQRAIRVVSTTSDGAAIDGTDTRTPE